MKGPLIVVLLPKNTATDIYGYGVLRRNHHSCTPLHRGQQSARFRSDEGKPHRSCTLERSQTMICRTLNLQMKFTTTLLEQSARLKHNRPAAITFHNRQMDTARKLKNLMKETALEWTGMRQNMQTL